MNEINIAYSKFRWKGDLTPKGDEELLAIMQKYNELEYRQDPKDDEKHIKTLKPLVEKFGAKIEQIKGHPIIRSSYVYFMFMKDDANTVVKIFKREKKDIEYWCLLPYAPPRVQGIKLTYR